MRLHCFNAIGELGETPGCDPASREQFVDKGHQQKGIGTGANEQMLVGHVPPFRFGCGSITTTAPPRPWIALSRFSMSGADISEPCDTIGIAAHADKEIGVIDIGDRKDPGVAVQQFAAQVLGLLVD